MQSVLMHYSLPRLPFTSTAVHAVISLAAAMSLATIRLTNGVMARHLATRGGHSVVDGVLRRRFRWPATSCRRPDAPKGSYDVCVSQSRSRIVTSCRRAISSMRLSSARLRSETAVWKRGLAVDAQCLAGDQPATTQDTNVHSFRDLRKHFNSFVLRVHPDVLGRFEAGVRATNEQSLAEVAGFLDAVERVCTARPGLVQAAAVNLPRETLRLKFYYVRQSAAADPLCDGDTAAPDADELASFEFNVRLPAALVAASNAPLKDSAPLDSIDSKVPNAHLLSEQWLSYVTRTVQGLLGKVGRDIRLRTPHDKRVKAGNTKVTSERQSRLQRLYGDVSRRITSRRARPFGSSVAELTKDNLLNMSPLAQGRREYDPAPQMNAVSLHSHRDRQSRVDMLVDAGVLQWRTSSSSAPLVCGAMVLA